MKYRVIREEQYKGKLLQEVVFLQSRDNEVSGSLYVPPDRELEGILIDGKDINWQPTLGQILGATDRIEAMKRYVDADTP